MPDVEGAGVEELFHGVAELFAGGIVEVGFEEDYVVLPVGEGCVGVAGGFWIPAFAGMTGKGVGMKGGGGLPRFARNDSCLAEPEAEYVGEGWGVFAADADADAVQGHGGLAVFVGEGGYQGRSGGGGEFADVGVEGAFGRDGGLGGGDDFQGGRRGIAVSVGSARAGGFAEDQGGCVDALDAELLETVDYADDIDQGVGVAEFVKVDVIRVAAVDTGLGGEQSLQDGGCGGAGLVRQGGCVGYGV